ncbi:MAG: hypothetical protein AABW63_02105 [Nanoarchaeota archaeon]
MKVLRRLYKDHNPRRSLEIMLMCSRIIPRSFKVSETLELFLRVDEKIRAEGFTEAFVGAANDFGFETEIIGAENIPDEKGTLYPSNHPYGMPEGAIAYGEFSRLVEKKGRKVIVVGDKILKLVPGIEARMIAVDPYGRNSLSSSRKIISTLKEDDVFLCPAAEISGENLREFPWRQSLGRIVKYAKNVVPVYFHGPDHKGHYNFFARHKLTRQIRLTYLMKEAWNKRGEKITMVIGEPIPRETLDSLGDNGKITAYIKGKCEELRYRAE